MNDATIYQKQFGKGPSFIRVYRYGIGLRVCSHYWHFRRDSRMVYSERHKLKCNHWTVGRWRLTHRWGLSV